MKNRLNHGVGQLGGFTGKHLLSAGVLRPGARDQAPPGALCSAGSLLLPLPLALLGLPPLCLGPLSHCLSLSVQSVHPSTNFFNSRSKKKRLTHGVLMNDKTLERCFIIIIFFKILFLPLTDRDEK